jgi:anti-sigma factor RsiW
MKCLAFEMLSAGVDGALSEHESHGVQAHLAGCERCRALRAELVLLKASVRDGAPAHPASEALKARLAASVVRRRRLRSAAIWVAAAAALVTVVVALGVARPWRANDLLAQLVGDHVLITLNEAKPLEVRDSDAGAIERWFGGKLDFALRLPRLDGASVVGGRVCNFAGRRVALTFYDLQGRRMSLFVTDRDDEGRASCSEGVRGFTICREPAHGLAYALVTDLPASEAQQLLRTGLEQLH